MKYAIKYYATPYEIAEEVAGLCSNIGPARGYTMEQYDGPRRLHDIAEMAEALRDGISQHERLQLCDPEQFYAVYKALESENYHTENLALALAFGDSGAVFDALQAVHHMGQSYAIGKKLQYPELVF